MSDKKDAEEVFGSMSRSFNLMFGASEGKLDTPLEVEVSFSGSEAEARGSARYLVDDLEEKGYSARQEYLGRVEAPVNDERHNFKFSVFEK